MDEDKIIECEVLLNRIFYPKGVAHVDSGENAIFSANIKSILRNDYEDKIGISSIKLKGRVCDLEYGYTYKVHCTLESTHETYGDTFKLLYISKVVDISNKDKQKEFLNIIAPKKIVDSLFDTFDDVIKLLDENDITSLCSVKGIGKSVAERLVNHYNGVKDYSDVYMKLTKFGFSDILISKLIDHYKSPDIVLNKIEKDPYSLIEVDGIGFIKADTIAMASGVDKYNPKRLYAFMKYYLNECGENGQSWILYEDLMKAVYDTMGFVPQEIFSSVAKNMIASNQIVALDGGKRIASSKYYNLEKSILNELIRLYKGREIEVVDSAIEESNDSEIEKKEYVPKDFTISDEDAQKRLRDIEIEQGFDFTDEQKMGILLGTKVNVMALTGGAGCVDCDTEFFDGYKWKKISDYKVGDKVLQYNEDGTAELVYPIDYIKQETEYLNRIFNKARTIDQIVSDEHNFVYFEDNKPNFIKFKDLKAELKATPNKYLKRYVSGTFNYSGKGIDLTDEEIRVMVIAIIDGSFYMKSPKSRKCRVNLMRDTQKRHLEKILSDANIEYEVKEYVGERGMTKYYFEAPIRCTYFRDSWYDCSKEQFKVIIDEVCEWDRSETQVYNMYYSTDKRNMDFIQFAATSCGKTVMMTINEKSKEFFNLKESQHRLSIAQDKDQKIFSKYDSQLCRIRKLKTKDGYEYCFTVPSHMLVLRRNYRIFITGNCGKTTTARGICKIFGEHDTKIVCMALSGKAATRITEATGLPASTIHRGLAWTPNEGFTYNKNNKLEADIVLVDEATMTNGSLFLSVLQAVPSGAKFFVLGDVQQLPSIGNCQIFSDMLESNTFPCVRLTKPHRQALRSGIIPLSIKIANQESIFDKGWSGQQILGELKDMEMYISDSKSEILSERVMVYFRQELNKYNGNVMDVQVVVPTNMRGDLSCYHLNMMIQEMCNPSFGEEYTIQVLLERAKKNQPISELKKYIIRKNDKVINILNNYLSKDIDGNVCPVFNGNVGVVEEIFQDGSCIVDFVGIGKIKLDKKESKNLLLAYACSVHKCQGSSAKSVIVAFDGATTMNNTNELFYTAITRASKYCILVSRNYCVIQAIKHKEVRTKQTFLKEFLIENKSVFSKIKIS